MQLQCQLQVELWGGQSPSLSTRQEGGNGHWSFLQQRTQGDQTPPTTPLCLDCEGIQGKKPQGFLWSGSLLKGISLSCCFVIYLLHHDEIILMIGISENSAMAKLGSSQWGNLVWLCECGVHSCAGALTPLRWYKSDCQSRSWMVTQGRFVIKFLTIRFEASDTY